MPPTTNPRSQKFSILFAPTRRELLVDAGVRVALMVAIAVLMFHWRNPMSGEVFWPILVTLELIIGGPLAMTLFLRSQRPDAKPLTPEEAAWLKAVERSSNQRALAGGILGIFIVIIAISSGWIMLMPCGFFVPLIFAYWMPTRNPPPSR